MWPLDGVEGENWEVACWDLADPVTVAGHTTGLVTTTAGLEAVAAGTAGDFDFEFVGAEFDVLGFWLNCSNGSCCLLQLTVT